MKHDEMPPDPWAEEGIDLWELEQAERLAHEGASGSDMRWDRLEGPTIDEFDDAERELSGCDADSAEECGTGLIGSLLPWMAALAAFVALVLFLFYAIVR